MHVEYKESEPEIVILKTMIDSFEIQADVLVSVVPCVMNYLRL